MRLSRKISLGALLAIAVASLASTVAAARPSPSDPIAAEIARWSTFLKSNSSKDEMWTQVKEAVTPVLARAEDALRKGRRLLALQRLAAAQANLAASLYVRERPPAQHADSGFEAEWKRMGNVLRADLRTPPTTALEGVQPAAVRAMGEAALPQVRIFYDASLEYGRNTMPDAGLFYIGSAQAQRDFAAFCRSISAPSPRPAPPLRSLAGEIDRLEGEMLAAYKPPASIDNHGDFIRAHSALKEARELDAAGLRYGALLRYLQAAQRMAPIRKAPVSLRGATLAKRLDDFDARLSSGRFDDSLGRLFLEAARDEAEGGEGRSPAAAATIAADVLPRYFAALEPARPAAPKPDARVTVTLVRWPYT
jgi:hypothetical protein